MSSFAEKPSPSRGRFNRQSRPAVDDDRGGLGFVHLLLLLGGDVGGGRDVESACERHFYLWTRERASELAACAAEWPVGECERNVNSASRDSGRSSGAVYQR